MDTNLRKSTSDKLYQYIIDTYGLDYPVLDHCQYFKDKGSGNHVVISHSYGFGVSNKYSSDRFQVFNKMVEDGFEIEFNPSSTYSEGTFSIRFEKKL